MPGSPPDLPSLLANRAAPGLALLCTLDGLIVTVLHNDFGLAEADLVGKPFPLVVAPSSFQKALSFVVELRARHTIFDTEFDLPQGDTLILVHCAGVVLDERLLILAAPSRTEARQLFEAMTGIHNDQSDQLRRLIKDQADRTRRPPAHELHLYDDLSRVNNELVTLQRDLAKKNIELERLNLEVQRLAIVDELTHLYNRRGFFELGQREVARAQRFGQPLAALMFDVDHFKGLNDTYGHALGDAVLAGVAERCQTQLRTVDIFGRYGGDEFVVLLPETTRAGAETTAERLRHHASLQPSSPEHGPLAVTISLGLAVLTPATVDLPALLAAADEALYEGKAAGGNRAV